ncbi:electron transporter SenC [Iodidimonas muriae]|uniref:Electron transporter SenC n=1 Tax=Iodidimonas muriae TaxID=261467 RepID=A0ABQ2L8F5_9PROT|nr:SCO family protein [Iodidimonas muriae]GGO06743.1 electron transporter SenC [Iodidimonas muriae]
MTLPRILSAALLVCLSALGLLYWASPDRQAPAPSDPVPIGGPFSLVSHEGKTVTDQDFQGRYMLIYFGYTFCPDVCPTELAKMTRALEQLEKEGVSLKAVQPLFITVDPERDDVEQMARYVSLFHPSLMGLTGSPEQIKTATDAYRVYAQKSGDVSSDAYLVDHASMILLMDPDGQFVDFFSSRETPDDMVAVMRPLLKAAK